jgi:hypothetical protein
MGGRVEDRASGAAAMSWPEPRQFYDEDGNALSVAFHGGDPSNLSGREIVSLVLPKGWNGAVAHLILYFPLEGEATISGSLDQTSRILDDLAARRPELLEPLGELVCRLYPDEDDDGTEAGPQTPESPPESDGWDSHLRHLRRRDTGRLPHSSAVSRCSSG